MAGIPPLNSEVLSAVEKLAAKPEVQAAFAEAERDVDRAMREQIELCEIEAPTFHEENRAKRVAELMRTYGLKDVVIDPIGNVVGRRPGRGNGPVLALGAHMDSVFPAGTDVKVRQEGRIYHAPGIGDNCSGLRALLQILRMYEDNHIETEGDLLFVGTVGEEGNGDIRGSKALFDGSRHIDGFIAIDSTDVGRILKGATGSHRWRICVDGTGGHSGMCRQPSMPFAAQGQKLPTSKFQRIQKPLSQSAQSRAAQPLTRLRHTARWRLTCAPLTMKRFCSLRQLCLKLSTKPWMKKTAVGMWSTRRLS